LRLAKLMSADLIWADLRRADLSGAHLREADLSEADLSEADLSEADLSGRGLGSWSHSPSLACLIFLVGFAAGIAWLSYGGAARKAIASWSPRLAWVAPAACPVAPPSG
jgi:uncharacterized protein YjbI with pentapeptide repeats